MLRNTIGGWRFAAMAIAIVMLTYAVYALTPAVGRTAADVTPQETAPAPPGREIATFSAGCFWSMQAMFQELKGVDKADPGYSGGSMPHPSYEDVETGNTGYAESINVVFDPSVISYGELVKVLLTARDPTTLNSQGPDAGTQYRSVIWYRTAAQKREAESQIRAVTASHVWDGAIVTTVQPFKSFYRAEAYHLDYYNRHPDEPYCRDVIAPEIARFHSLYRAEIKG